VSVRRALIVDSGGANLASLCFAIERLGVEVEVSASPAKIRSATHVILPGVGSAAAAMQCLKASRLADRLPTLTQPVLGICLGMQLLFERSAEGDTTTLGIIPGSVHRIAACAERPVPHMGWNTVHALDADSLFAGIAVDSHMYFVHSFAADISTATIASVDYGAAFSAAVRVRNFYGVQFHPERSAAPGAKLLANFLSLPSCC
jgi:glutamine amidotransferase